MKVIRTVWFMSLIAFCIATAVAQDSASSSSAANDVATNRVKFELGLEMLRGYRADLQDRLEKSAALLIIVIGWLITSETARKSIASNSFLFWGGVVILTALMFMYCLTIYNFIGHIRYIGETIKDLGYMEPKYFTRYYFPDRVFSAPVPFSYIAPILSLYICILLLLFQIKYRFISSQSA